MVKKSERQICSGVFDCSRRSITQHQPFPKRYELIKDLYVGPVFKDRHISPVFQPTVTHRYFRTALFLRKCVYTFFPQSRELNKPISSCRKEHSPIRSGENWGLNSELWRDAKWEGVFSFSFRLKQQDALFGLCGSSILLRGTPHHLYYCGGCETRSLSRSHDRAARNMTTIEGHTNTPKATDRPPIMRRGAGSKRHIVHAADPCLPATAFTFKSCLPPWTD